MDHSDGLVCSRCVIACILSVQADSPYGYSPNSRPHLCVRSECGAGATTEALTCGSCELGESSVSAGGTNRAGQEVGEEFCWVR